MKRILIATLLVIGIVAGNVTAYWPSDAGAAVAFGQKSLPTIDDIGSTRFADALLPAMHTIKPVSLSVISFWLIAVASMLLGLRAGPGVISSPLLSYSASRRIYLRNSVLLI